MRILITGGTGFIGGHCVPAFLANNHHVTLLVRESYSAGKVLPPHLAQIREQFELVYGDLRNFNLTVRAVREAEPDKVVHLATMGATDPFLPAETALRYNVTGTINLLRACFEKNWNCQQLIVARTPGELTAMNTYAASKAAAWTFCQMYARTHGWQINGAMIFQAYGARQSPQTLIPSAWVAAQAGQDFPMTSGAQMRDWIHVSDVVAGLLAGVESEGLDAGVSFDLGTGKLTSVADVVRHIYKIADGSGKPLIGVLPNRPGETILQVADVTQTNQLLNWQAKIPLELGLRQQ